MTTALLICIEDDAVKGRSVDWAEGNILEQYKSWSMGFSKWSFTECQDYFWEGIWKLIGRMYSTSNNVLVIFS